MKLLTFSHSSDATTNISASLKIVFHKVVQKSPPYSRGVYSSRKNKLFPSTKHHLPNPSPTSKLQVPSNQGHRSIFQKNFCDDSVGQCQMPTCAHRGVSEGGCAPPQKLKNFVFLKLESCNLMNTFGHKFRAGNE